MTKKPGQQLRRSVAISRLALINPLAGLCLLLICGTASAHIPTVAKGSAQSSRNDVATLTSAPVNAGIASAPCPADSTINHIVHIDVHHADADVTGSGFSAYCMYVPTSSKISPSIVVKGSTSPIAIDYAKQAQRQSYASAVATTKKTLSTYQCDGKPHNVDGSETLCRYSSPNIGGEHAFEFYTTGDAAGLQSTVCSVFIDPSGYPIQTQVSITAKPNSAYARKASSKTLCGRAQQLAVLD